MAKRRPSKTPHRSTPAVEQNRYLIVDGHSMIFSWPDLAEMHQRNGTRARNELAMRLLAYQDGSGQKVVLVFDGKGQDVTRDDMPDGIQVFYSRAGMSADAIIERLATKYGKEYDLTVASRDRLVLDAASASGALAISAQGLLDLVEEENRHLRERINRLKKS